MLLGLTKSRRVWSATISNARCRQEQIRRTSTLNRTERLYLNHREIFFHVGSLTYIRISVACSHPPTNYKVLFSRVTFFFFPFLFFSFFSFCTVSSQETSVFGVISRILILIQKAITYVLIVIHIQCRVTQANLRTSVTLRDDTEIR